MKSEKPAGIFNVIFICGLLITDLLKLKLIKNSYSFY